MLQGSYLGPLTFIILIDSLRPGYLTHTFVDDTTMTEILDKSAVSCMRIFIDELVQWHECEWPKDERNTIRLNSQRPAAACLPEWYTCGTSYDV